MFIGDTSPVNDTLRGTTMTTWEHKQKDSFHRLYRLDCQMSHKTGHLGQVLTSRLQTPCHQRFQHPVHKDLWLIGEFHTVPNTLISSARKLSKLAKTQLCKIPYHIACNTNFSWGIRPNIRLKVVL